MAKEKKNYKCIQCNKHDAGYGNMYCTTCESAYTRYCKDTLYKISLRNKRTGEHKKKNGKIKQV